MATRSATLDDLPRLRYLGSRAFGVADEKTIDAWVERGGADQWRVLEDRGEVAACALRVPQGHFYGGRSVSMLGLAGVSTAPEARGRRLGVALMTDLLREARAEGFALSTLFPSTREFYRTLGYELAGDHATITCDPHRWPRGVPADEIVRVETEAHRDEVKAIYAKVMTHREGALDRGPYVWGRVFDSLRFRLDVYLMRRAGQAVAYAAVMLPPGDAFYDVMVYDWAFADAHGLQAIFHFLAGYRSLSGKLSYTGAISDALTSALPARSYEAKMEEPYMMRLLDAPKAFRERGYPQHVQADLSVEITEDAVCPENVGTYRLRLADGRADVLRLPAGQGADIRGPIQAVSALYSPWMPASDLARMGWLEGAPDALRRAEQVFGLRRPYLCHMF